MRKIAWAGLAILIALMWSGFQTMAARSLESVATAPLALQPVPSEEASAQLVSRRVDAAPIVDGRVDAAWDQAKLLEAPLFWGFDGTEHAMDVQLRALHTDDTIYFLAQWPGDPLPASVGDAVNKLIVHWRLPEPGEGLLPPSCMVACHTAFADAQGSFSYVHPETIPVGSSTSLPFGGGRRDGTWTLEWSRPRVNDNPFDLQFSDADQAYRFFVKVLEWIDGRPDAISKWQFLVFEPG